MPRRYNIKPIQSLLNRPGSLKPLALKSQQLQTLNKRFLSCLPSMLASFCELSSYQHGHLIVHTHSNAVAAQLRFMSPGLIPQLQQISEFSELKSLEFKVIPAKTNTSKPKSASRPLPVSDANRRLLEDTASAVSSQELAASLRKLAKTLKLKKLNQADS